jgi:cysteine desulfurase
MNHIYLDYAATTPVDPRVVDAMLPFFSDTFGNPSSAHRLGQKAEAALEQARKSIADLLHCTPREVLFTSCGSESDNLALRGAAFSARKERKAHHILISPLEHHAVSHTAEQLADVFDFEVEYLPVDSQGRVDPQDVADRLRPTTALVSVIHANNEIGTLNPISEIGGICREAGVPLHTDSVQGGAHLKIDVDALQVDLLSLGAHKFYGPKGIGVLYVREGTQLLPQQTGGAQEFGLRAGTENTPLIVGFTRAFQLAQQEHANRAAQSRDLRDEIISRVLEGIPGVQLTGHPRQRLPNHTSFAFAGLDGNTLITLLDQEGFACSSGSACKSGQPEPSQALLRLGFSEEWALGGLRVTVGKDTTREDIEAFLTALPGVVERARTLA